MATADAIDRLDLLSSADYANAMERLRGGRRVLSQGLSVLNQIVISAGLVAGFAALLAAISPDLLAFPAAVLAAAAIYHHSQRITSAAEAAVAERQRASLHLYDLGTGSTEGKELRVYDAGPRVAARFSSGWRATDADLTKAAWHAVAWRALAWLILGAGLGTELWVLASLHPGKTIPGIAFLTIISVIQLADQGSRCYCRGPGPAGGDSRTGVRLAARPGPRVLAWRIRCSGARRTRPWHPPCRCRLPLSRVDAARDQRP